MRMPSKTFFSAIGAITAAAAAARFVLRSSRRMDLQDKVVFITGGSRGLGLVLAREFSNRGARLGICARSEKELERVRLSLARGCPLGPDDWTRRTASRLNVQHTLRREGRPAKKKKAEKN